ncbi:M1 family metallopeptidase [Flavobacterium sp. MAH-1]|uniref:Aminopeptidase N n=1 Tax=Flavobacterium agri TaxID=2743471 RepID=A0A7Y8XZP9_9FLAO|nr:M1 family metallopeptidase [Flavobacterium agri]NUY79735.1 M1 family metallopeptidase [Flavobacterium agri]NYA69760.1 M1 family metallopeptidase [Flavobacterium agri]
MRSNYIFLLLFGTSIFAQVPNPVDFKTANGNLFPDYANRSIKGEARYEFDVAKKPDTIFIDAQNMDFSEVEINGKAVKFAHSAKQLKLFQGYKKGKNVLTLQYSAKPKQTLYFVTAGNDHQIWTQGQGKYTSHWFPSFDDVNEKVVFGLTITYDKAYQVISNGSLQSKSSDGQSTKWSFQMKQPMSSYLLMLAIGKFERHDVVAKSGTPSELYIEPGDASKFEPTYRYSKQIFDFFEKEIQFDYPWDVYRQIPVRDFLYGGMENTTATIFTRDYVCDDIAFNDRNYVNVNGHELAHQWFGDVVTAKSGKHHWLQEGFATYYALLGEREVFGDDYFYSKLYDMAINLQQAAKTDTIPVMNEKASSLSFYQKGAWALHVLRENVGADNFRKAVKTYLEKYKFRNVETDDFLNEIAKVSNYDVAAFKKRWLETAGFEVNEAIGLLKKNASMQKYFETGEMGSQPFAENKSAFEDLMRSDAYFPIKEQVVYLVGDVPFEQKKELIDLAMKTNEVNVRQAVARTTKKIPAEFQAQYETLLDDKSYITQEIAFNALCRDFPENRAKYLDKMDGRIGMNDKNIRLLWLALALSTKEYRLEKKAGYYDELFGYAQAGEEASVRQDAIEKLLYIDKGDKNVLPLLVNATVHHKWQFSKYGRDKIREKLKLQNTRKFYEELLPTLPENEKAQLQRLIDEK